MHIPAAPVRAISEKTTFISVQSQGNFSEQSKKDVAIDNNPSALLVLHQRKPF